MDNNNEQQAPTIFWRIDEWFPDLSPETKTRLKTYHEELIKFNRTVNLISAKTILVADALHFADSLLAAKIITQSHPQIDKIYDLGSGNGFPGLVFAIYKPTTQVVLVEIDQKKCEFLQHMISTLGLKNVTVENKNVEALGDNTVKFAITRGFANISRTILAARKIMPKGGQLFHLKGEEWGIEVGEIPSQLCSIWSPSLVGEYKLPVGAVKFGVVKTEKIA
ncbi:16S rRNA (guanine(527)-N(7))-methyltransferase RsmG [Bdellovibrio sp. NC01]|uniref:16S rRNA (guanine(527)-N(7))-methyltransferase RsmG n=1 Tax=Bdellovibrio sp. NC01 TaxID=2220073 RepID=UPI001157D16C|nr:16S rRNA (guanine(527)-N(7))-methyltransferase RsmG [Bdellovibrio sp. NC01]QDK39566.1 16S rRNA (guanine(527)-N(7))-methyltransferase RsmG [Bdellovibrio sp. NC01]